MTRKDIEKEMKTCNLRIRQLQREMLTEDDFAVAKTKIDEMVLLAKRVSELDTMNKNMILIELKTKTDKLINNIKRGLKIR